MNQRVESTWFEVVLPNPNQAPALWLKCGHRHFDREAAEACRRRVHPGWRVARAKLVVYEETK